MKLLYRIDPNPETIRVWREDWIGDQFEVLTQTDFADLKQFIRTYDEDAPVSIHRLLGDFVLVEAEED